MNIPQNSQRMQLVSGHFKIKNPVELLNDREVPSSKSHKTAPVFDGGSGLTKGLSGLTTREMLDLVDYKNADDTAKS